MRFPRLQLILVSRSFERSRMTSPRGIFRPWNWRKYNWKFNCCSCRVSLSHACRSLLVKYFSTDVFRRCLKIRDITVAQPFESSVQNDLFQGINRSRLCKKERKNFARNKTFIVVPGFVEDPPTGNESSLGTRIPRLFAARHQPPPLNY